MFHIHTAPPPPPALLSCLILSPPHPHPPCCAALQVEGRPGMFDIRLEDGQTIYSRAAEPGAAELPAPRDLFDRLRQAGLQAAA